MNDRSLNETVIGVQLVLLVHRLFSQSIHSAHYAMYVRLDLYIILILSDAITG